MTFPTARSLCLPAALAVAAIIALDLCGAFSSIRFWATDERRTYVVNPTDGSAFFEHRGILHNGILVLPEGFLMRSVNSRGPTLSNDEVNLVNTTPTLSYADQNLDDIYRFTQLDVGVPLRWMSMSISELSPSTTTERLSQVPDLLASRETLRIRPLSLVLNILTWTLVMALASRLLANLMSRSRVSRGLCRACGYPRAGTCCSECGAIHRETIRPTARLARR